MGSSKNVVNLKTLSNEQIQARDEIANYIRSRMEPIVESRIKNFLKQAAAGELEAIDKVTWEWTIRIEGKEMEHIKELVVKMRG